MKCGALISLGEDVFGNFERLDWGKAGYTCLFKGVSQDWFVNLPIPSVGAVDSLKWDRLGRAC
jgi:hypothetical protein